MEAQASSAPRIRVAAILLSGGSLVLVKHVKGDSEYFLLPGGGVEPGERLDAALVREVLEETGLECQVSAPVLISDSIAPDGSRHMVQIVFTADVTGGDLTPSPEDPRIAHSVLVATDELSALDFRPPIAGSLQSILEAAAARADIGPRYVAAQWKEDPNEVGAG